ncbi:hypothetical protein F5Y10DRAFT_284850 [Nemania abortiva]|nr:hypothetical protein F5Y10DRAFT_284850 [Nemania abortiva]
MSSENPKATEPAASSESNNEGVIIYRYPPRPPVTQSEIERWNASSSSSSSDSDDDDHDNNNNNDDGRPGLSHPRGRAESGTGRTGYYSGDVFHSDQPGKMAGLPSTDDDSDSYSDLPRGQRPTRSDSHEESDDEGSSSKATTAEAPSKEPKAKEPVAGSSKDVNVNVSDYEASSEVDAKTLKKRESLAKKKRKHKKKKGKEVHTDSDPKKSENIPTDYTDSSDN